MPKLKVVARYFNLPHGLDYEADQEIEVDEALAAFLLADSPGCFEEVGAKAADAPPKDKAVKKPARKKAAAKKK